MSKCRMFFHVVLIQEEIQSCMRFNRREVYLDCFIFFVLKQNKVGMAICCEFLTMQET